MKNSSAIRTAKTLVICLLNKRNTTVFASFYFWVSHPCEELSFVNGFNSLHFSFSALIGQFTLYITLNQSLFCYPGASQGFILCVVIANNAFLTLSACSGGNAPRITARTDSLTPISSLSVNSL